MFVGLLEERKSPSQSPDPAPHFLEGAVGVNLETPTMQKYGTAEEVRIVVNDACQKCGYPETASKITIEFTKRLKTTLGQANSKKMMIRFNSNLWPRTPDKDRRETIIHEVCHILLDVAYPKNRQAHGRL